MSYSSKLAFVQTADGSRTPVRSKLEAKWATFFSLMGYEWKYEPKTFELPGDIFYKPDFYVPEVGWFEIKPTRQHAIDSSAKIEAFLSMLANSEGQWRKNLFLCHAGYPTFRHDATEIYSSEPNLPENFSYLTALKTRRLRTIFGVNTKSFESFVSRCLAAASNSRFP